MKLFSFFLPQFHPDKMNDLFWEKGFTDWITTSRASTLFKGHEQPFLPSDLGFYDLSIPETLEKQAYLAKRHGLDGFGIYHYFFDEKTRALNIPIENLRKTPSINIDYFICWVNADWDKEWVGDYQTILYKQKYSSNVFKKIAEDACWHFQDNRYVKIDGKPLYYIHNPKNLDIVNFKEEFLKTTRKYGFDKILFAAPQIHISDGQQNHIDYALGYPPGDYPIRNIQLKSEMYSKVKSGVFSYPDYSDKYSSFVANKINELKYVPTVLSGWDNTPRYKDRGFVFLDFNPKDFYNLTQTIFKSSIEKNKDFVMFKAWNEWAEGNVLEPSIKFESKILQIVEKIRREIGF